jgi:hypothetical protein
LTRTDSAAALDVTEADPAALVALLSARPVRLRSLVRDRAGHAAALRRARAIRDDVRDLFEQHGVAAGALAVGMAAWTTPTGEPRTAPVLLSPLSIAARSASEDDFEFSVGANATLNRAWVTELFDSYGVTLDASRGYDLRPGDPTEPAELYERLRRDAASVLHLTVSHRLLLGTYTDAAPMLGADLSAVTELLGENPVGAVLAGDAGAAGEMAAEPLIRELSAPDEIDPAEEFLAVDADAPASAAIAAVLAGRHLVIEGAPGTGGTQTTANLLAALAAAGRTVLVLAENRRVAAQLLERLTAVGLGDLLLDAAGDGEAAGRQRIAAAVAAATHPLPAVPDLTGVRDQLRDSRNRLAGHARTLHSIREPWGVSVYGAQAALLGLPAEAVSRVRFEGPVLAGLCGDALAEVRDAVREWSQLGGTTLTGLDTPWFGARVASAAEAERAQCLAAELATEIYPGARAALERTLAEAGLAPVATVSDWRGVLRLLAAVAETERLLSAEVWAAPLAELVAATGDAGTRREQGERAGWQDRMAARRAARRLWQGEKPVGAELYDALVQASTLRAEWSRRALRSGPSADSSPRPVGNLDATETSYARLLDALAALALFLPDRDFPRLAPAVLDKTLQGLATDPVLHRLPRLGELTARCSALGLRPFLLDLHTRRLAAQWAPTAFEHVWLSSVLAQVAANDPAYGSFDPAALTRTVAEYQRADREHIASTAPRLRRRVREAIAAAVAQHPEQAAAVRAGAGAEAGGLRALLSEAPDVVLAAAPCWILSPYAVPKLLPARRLFDVAIVAAANAVSVPVAASGLARAGQIVAIGDRRLLPPRELAETVEIPTRRMSLLDALAPVLPRVGLETFHRRTDERLVGFAAATVYGGGLRTTPGPDRSDLLRYVPVPHNSGTPGQEDSVTAEVQKVVGLVIDHAVRFPEESFGVVTLGTRHAERIAAALRVALVGRPELGDVFRGDAAERFFVMPCSAVAGELRDAIVFTTGLGKTPEGRPSYRFGPLDDDGGERLLTVGLTRARRSLTLVTSLASTDLDPTRLPSAGSRLLRALLRYAEVPELRRTAYAQPPPPDGLDLDLRQRLRAAGLPVVADYGLGSRRIALALAAPDRLVLAVETDGPRWAAEPTVRDRDRLRPERLHGLGWAVCEVYATQWFRDPDGEVSRIRAAYQAALPGSG